MSAPVSQLVTITFNTRQTARMVDFYRALGAELRADTVNKGGAVHRGTLANIELVLHAIAKGPAADAGTPDVSIRFELTGIQEIYDRVRALPGADVLMDLEAMPTGRVFIAVDPDGHSVEVFEPFPTDHDSE